MQAHSLGALSRALPSIVTISFTIVKSFQGKGVGGEHKTGGLMVATGFFVVGP